MSAVLDNLARHQPGYGLPPQCYTEDAFLQEELETLFRSEWHCVGRVDEVPNVGDYFTIDFIGEPLLIVRESEAGIVALSNVCRHRSMPVAEGAGNTQKFKCPYHAWTYNLDGKLRHAPLVPKDKLRKDCALPRLVTRCWQGFIFISLSAGASWPSDSQSLAALETHIENYHMHEMHHAVSFTEEWECNWKSLVENFLDGYHLSVVHPETLHHLTPTSLCKKVGGSPDYTLYTANYANTAPAREHFHPSLSEDQVRQSQLFGVFPALVASLSADTLVYLALRPVSTHKVSVKWGIATYESDLSSDELTARIDKWCAINAEDHQILKQLHWGLSSRFTETGPLAAENYEGTLVDFHHYLVNKLAGIEIQNK